MTSLHMPVFLAAGQTCKLGTFCSRRNPPHSGTDLAVSSRSATLTSSQCWTSRKCLAHRDNLISSHVRRTSGSARRSRIVCGQLNPKQPDGGDDQLTEEALQAMDREAEYMAAQFLEQFEDYDDFGDQEALTPGGDLQDLVNDAFDKVFEEADDVDGSAGGEAGAADGPKLTARAARKARKPQPARVPDHLLPKVAIIGRPNVGKSALFNRIGGTQAAIVYDTPGVTRDRMYLRTFWCNRDFLLIDTGGLIEPLALREAELQGLPSNKGMDPGVAASAEMIPGLIEGQAAEGVKEADGIIVVCDGQVGPTAADQDILDWLRRKFPKKPAVLAVNKCESQSKGLYQAATFWEFGQEPFPVSALHGSGTAELLDALLDQIPSAKEIEMDFEEEEPPLRVAVIGRPNAGKSSLINNIIGRERSIVSQMAGTTRDAVDTEFTRDNGSKFVFVDTAGLRRRNAVAAGKDAAEALSVKSALKAVRRSDVIVLVIDAVEGPVDQDYHLAEQICAAGKGCVICINKWDTVPDKETNTMVQYRRNLKHMLRIIGWAPAHMTVATTGSRVSKLLDAVEEAGAEHRRRITTATLNMVLREATTAKQPPASGNKKGRIFYCTQASTRPPTFVMFVNDPKLFIPTYRRYIERSLREQIGLEGTPIRILWRGKSSSVAEWKKDVRSGTLPKRARRLAPSGST